MIDWLFGTPSEWSQKTYEAYKDYLYKLYREIKMKDVKKWSTERMAESFLLTCKRLYDAFQPSKPNKYSWGFQFSWNWFVKGVNALPKYNKGKRRDFSTPMGRVIYVPFYKSEGKLGYIHRFVLKLQPLSTWRSIDKVIYEEA